MLNCLMLLLLFAAPLAYASSHTVLSNSLINPLNPQFSSIPAFIAGLLSAFLKLAIPVIGLLMVWAGFMFILAQGNEQKLKDAKKNFLYVIIGTALVLGAWAIATLIAGTISQIAR
jgi:hypothetical protein